jgi:hypothetical protein
MRFSLHGLLRLLICFLPAQAVAQTNIFLNEGLEDLPISRSPQGTLSLPPGPSQNRLALPPGRMPHGPFLDDGENAYKLGCGINNALKQESCQELPYGYVAPKQRGPLPPGQGVLRQPNNPNYVPQVPGQPSPVSPPLAAPRSAPPAPYSGGWVGAAPPPPPAYSSQQQYRSSPPPPPPTYSYPQQYRSPPPPTQYSTQDQPVSGPSGGFIEGERPTKKRPTVRRLDSLERPSMGGGGGGSGRVVQ